MEEIGRRKDGSAKAADSSRGTSTGFAVARGKSCTIAWFVSQVLVASNISSSRGGRWPNRCLRCAVHAGLGARLRHNCLDDADTTFQQVAAEIHRHLGEPRPHHDLK